MRKEYTIHKARFTKPEGAMHFAMTIASLPMISDITFFTITTNGAEYIVVAWLECTEIY